MTGLLGEEVSGKEEIGCSEVLSFLSEIRTPEREPSR
jgi:hypothetical protein